MLRICIQLSVRSVIKLKSDRFLPLSYLTSVKSGSTKQWTSPTTNFNSYFIFVKKFSRLSYIISSSNFDIIQLPFPYTPFTLRGWRPHHHHHHHPPTPHTQNDLKPLVYMQQDVEVSVIKLGVNVFTLTKYSPGHTSFQPKRGYCKLSNHKMKRRVTYRKDLDICAEHALYIGFAMLITSF